MGELRAVPDRRSRCPFCRARGVKQYQPIVSDGVPADRPYCGWCGKNYPMDERNATPADGDPHATEAR